jgi:hypothetical protein
MPVIIRSHESSTGSVSDAGGAGIKIVFIHEEK